MLNGPTVRGTIATVIARDETALPARSSTSAQYVYVPCVKVSLMRSRAPTCVLVSPTAPSYHVKVYGRVPPVTDTFNSTLLLESSVRIVVLRVCSVIRSGRIGSRTCEPAAKSDCGTINDSTNSNLIYQRINTPYVHSMCDTYVSVIRTIWRICCKSIGNCLDLFSSIYTHAACHLASCMCGG